MTENIIFYTLYGVVWGKFIIFAPKRVYSYDSISKICEGDAQAVRAYAS